MPPITACVITLNEEDNIGRVLESLGGFPEVILLDSGSVDKTLEIASKFKNTTIHYRAFDNYIDQKNYCISLSKNDWILSLDADECITEKFWVEISSFPDIYWSTYCGFESPRLSFYLGKWIYHGGWYPNYQLRLFNRKFGKFEGVLVHEKVRIQGKSQKIHSPILHYSYKNISHHLKFINTYSSLAAEEKFRKGQKSGVVFAVLKCMFKFFSMYILKLGFLDGRPGLVIAVLGGYYNFLKYIKIYENHLNPKKDYDSQKANL